MTNRELQDREIKEQIISVLAVIRPYLNADGGDVEFLHFENGIVYIRMVGACMGCMDIDATVNGGIKEVLVENVPGVVDVINCP